MVAVSLWMAAIFSPSNGWAFTFSFTCFLFVILGNTINQFQPDLSVYAKRYFLISSLLTGLVLMVMIGHQINVANQGPLGAGPSRVTENDEVQIWRWGLLLLPLCFLSSWLLAYGGALIRAILPAAPKNLPSSGIVDSGEIQWDETPRPQRRK